VNKHKIRCGQECFEPVWVVLDRWRGIGNDEINIAKSVICNRLTRSIHIGPEHFEIRPFGGAARKPSGQSLLWVKIQASDSDTVQCCGN